MLGGASREWENAKNMNTTVSVRVRGLPMIFTELGGSVRNQKDKDLETSRKLVCVGMHRLGRVSGLGQ